MFNLARRSRREKGLLATAKKRRRANTLAASETDLRFVEQVSFRILIKSIHFKKPSVRQLSKPYEAIETRILDQPMSRVPKVSSVNSSNHEIWIL